MRVSIRRVAGAVALAMAAGASQPPVAAQQSLGTFRWGMQPYCNVVTFVVEAQAGTAFTLTGYDDRCGSGAPRAAAGGTAVQNADGSIALGFTIVAPDGVGTHVNATVDLATVSGTWRDESGNTGTFAFNPAATSGSPRPAPLVHTVLIAPAAVTPDKLAATVFAGTGIAGTAARSDHAHDDLVSSSVLGSRGLLAQAEVSGDTFRFQRSSNGATLTVTHTSVGRYLIQLPGFGGSVLFDQSVQVTASSVGTGVFWRTCGVVQRTQTQLDLSVLVDCFNSSFERADASFFITVTG